MNQGPPWYSKKFFRHLVKIFCGFLHTHMHEQNYHSGIQIGVFGFNYIPRKRCNANSKNWKKFQVLGISHLLIGQGHPLMSASWCRRGASAASEGAACINHWLVISRKACKNPLTFTCRHMQLVEFGKFTFRISASFGYDHTTVKIRHPSDLPSQAPLGLVSTWMGDRLGTPGVVLFWRWTVLLKIIFEN